jgi:phage terminase large subunit-like protein
MKWIKYKLKNALHHYAIFMRNAPNAPMHQTNITRNDRGPLINWLLRTTLLGLQTFCYCFRRDQHHQRSISHGDMEKAPRTIPPKNKSNIRRKNKASLLSPLLAESFLTNMKGTIQYDGSISSSFEIKSGVKQGCVLAPTLFGIFF